MLSHALHASFATDDQRASDRRVLRLEARVATPAGESGIQVHNLSRSGLLLEGLIGIGAGADIEIQLPCGSATRATVVWADDTLFGCRFLTPLTQAQVSAALLRADPVPIAKPIPLSQADAFSKLRQHWDQEPEVRPEPAANRKLPLALRGWLIAGLGLTAWAVPAAAAWMVF